MRLTSVVVVVASLLVTGAAALVARAAVQDQDAQLLRERANEVALVFDASVGSLPTRLTTLGQLAVDGGTNLFLKEASADVKAGPGTLTFALLRPAGTGYVVVAESGHALSDGERMPATVAAVVARAQRTSTMVATPVLGSGSGRELGFALGGPAVPAGFIVYEENTLGSVHPPRQAGTAPFHEVRVVLYTAPRPEPSQVLVATTTHLPLLGDVDYVRITAGQSRWVLAVSAMHPLIGSFAASAPWIALGIGLLLSLLVTLVVEQVSRRRDMAVAAYVSERDLAETLQRKLLPTLPELSGLDISSRYVAASHYQQVGGDWFDAFDLGGGRAAVVIGDVIGHDLEAAAAMAQLRASLRAYAWEGGGPAEVVERLASLVDAFSIAGLVTVIYCVLEPPDEEGARRLRWANAGHLPPLLRSPDGSVRELSDGGSRVIGAPGSETRDQGETLVDAGSALILYTDGLVEMPRTPLDVSIRQLQHAVSERGPDDSASDICDHILAVQASDASRDDIALVVTRILPTRVAAEDRHGSPDREDPAASLK